MPPLIDLRWWPLTPVAIVWFTQYLEKSWENARKSKAVHQIIFHADHNWKQKYHGFICHCSNTPPDDAQRDIYVLSNISTFILTPDKLQRSKMYFSDGAKCISPTEQNVFLQLSRLYFSTAKECCRNFTTAKLVGFQKFDWSNQSWQRCNKLRQRARPSNKISCFKLWKAQQRAMGLLCPFELGVSDLTSHPSLVNACPWPWPSNLIDIFILCFWQKSCEKNNKIKIHFPHHLTRPDKHPC